ncbi:hypothetical protein [Pseudomonas antarctica]|uniref:hypothetical protein n=1 Tax=Pseudomonas antarctica TaxID=219572 RepID=UPI00387B78A0
MADLSDRFTSNVCCIAPSGLLQHRPQSLSGPSDARDNVSNIHNASYPSERAYEALLLGVVGNRDRIFLDVVLMKEEQPLKQRWKVLCVAACCGLVLTPWEKIPEMTSSDVSGYYISDGGLSTGYKVLKIDRSGDGEMYSYDAMHHGILNAYPFKYSSTFLTITLDFMNGNQSVLSEGWLGLEGSLHCSKGSCGGLGTVSRVGERETDLPEEFQRAFSIMAN